MTPFSELHSKVFAATLLYKDESYLNYIGTGGSFQEYCSPEIARRGVNLNPAGHFCAR
jgi:hypothetical protein